MIGRRPIGFRLVGEERCFTLRFGGYFQRARSLAAQRFVLRCISTAMALFTVNILAIESGSFLEIVWM